MKKIILPKKELYNLYVKKQWMVKDIAKYFGCCGQIVTRHLKKYNIHIPHRKNTQMLNIQCANCNKMFEIKQCYYNAAKKRHQKNFVCSKQCQKQLHSKRMKGTNNPNFGNPKNMKGKNHPRYKDGRSFEVLYCQDCGKQLCSTAYTHQTKYCNICKQLGAKNPNYIDGRSYYADPSEFSRKLKAEIRKRDNYTCQLCHISEKEYKKEFKRVLDIHHIDYNRLNNKKSNLITLCNICNNKVNKDREKWEKYFKNMIKRR